MILRRADGIYSALFTYERLLINLSCLISCFPKKVKALAGYGYKSKDFQ